MPVVPQSLALRDEVSVTLVTPWLSAQPEELFFQLAAYHMANEGPYFTWRLLCSLLLVLLCFGSAFL